MFKIEVIMDITKITNNDFVIDSNYKRRYIKPNIIKNYGRKTENIPQCDFA